VARLIALVALRFRLDLRVLLGARERLVGLVFMVPGLLFLSGVSCVVALVGIKTVASTHPEALVPALSAAATVVGLLWCLSPLFTGFALAESHDMSRLLHFPIPLPTLVASSLVANLAQPAVLAELPMLVCVALATAGVSLRLPLAFFGVALSFLTVLAAAQLAGLALHGLARNRRLHDLALSAGVVLGFFMSLVPLLLLTRGGAVMGGVFRFVVATDLFALSPFAWGVRAAAYAGRGEAVPFAAFSALGVLAILATMGATAALIQRVYRGDVVLAGRGLVTRPARMLFSGPIGTLVEKDLRSAWRDPALKGMLLVGFAGPLFFLFVLSQTRLDAGAGHGLVWLATLVGLSGFGANALGLERRGISLLLGFPVARERLLVAKNLSAMLLRLPGLATLVLAALVLSSPVFVPAVLTVTLVTMLQAAGVDNYLAVLFPAAAPAPGRNPYAGPVSGGRGFGASVVSLALLVVALVCAGPFAFLAWLPALLDRPLLFALTLPLALAGSAAVYAMLVAGAGRLLSRREPELLERILGEA
jgi:hypothetical protein